MIATMSDTSWASYTPSDTYYFRVPITFTSCYAPESKPTKGELAARWWKYVTGFTPKLQEVLSRLILIVRKVQIPRIHHERQYPRVIKYRNNRRP